MAEPLQIHRFKAGNDGCVAYLVQDVASGQAAVIDPRLDQVDEIAGFARSHQACVTWVFDTHTHADHLSGVRKLAELVGARILLHQDSRSRLTGERVTDGATLPLGRSQLQVLHAPGHTPDSIAIVAGSHLFTGDALLVGGAGRTDFMGGSASQLFDTFEKFKALLPDTVVHPGHDYGGRPETSIGDEIADNEAFRLADRESLVSFLSGTKPPPANLSTILAFNLVQPPGDTISPAELSHALRATAPSRLLDVRTPAEYMAEHIAGARLIPLDQLEARLDEVPEDVPQVVICRSGMRATTAAQLLARHGRTGRVLTGGMMAWRKAGLPLVEAPAPLPIDRQVQLIVGMGVLSSVALGVFVHTGFLAIAAFFGAGLTFAGATGICGLGMVLARMPWNRLPAGAAPSTCAGGPSMCAAGPVAAQPVCAAGATRKSSDAPV